MKFFDPAWVLTDAGLSASASARFHMGIFSEPFLSRIYSGEKTLESRITIHRTAPYDQVAPGDIVFIKRSSGPIEAVFTVGRVLQHDLTRFPLVQLRETYGSALCADDAFWQRKQHCRYATLMEITQLTRITPFSIHKKGMQTWILLD